MAQKRFFLYHNIAKLLGVNGLNKRARLPSCVYKRIKELYPDPERRARGSSYEGRLQVRARIAMLCGRFQL